MTDHKRVDPLDALGAIYETMYEHVAENLHKAKDRSGPLIHQLIEEALILGDDDPMVKRAGRNIPWLRMLSYNRLRAHDLFYGGKLVVTESAAQRLNEFYSDSKGTATGPGKEKP